MQLVKRLTSKRKKLKIWQDLLFVEKSLLSGRCTLSKTANHRHWSKEGSTKEQREKKSFILLLFKNFFKLRKQKVKKKTQNYQVVALFVPLHTCFSIFFFNWSQFLLLVISCKLNSLDTRKCILIQLTAIVPTHKYTQKLLIYEYCILYTFFGAIFDA